MKRTLLGLALLTLGLSSCKDFLTVVPETERTTANFYNTAADFNTALVGTYATFKHAGLYGNGAGSLIWMGEVSSDNTEYGSPRTGTGTTVSAFEIEDLRYSLANTYFRDAWLGHYQGIARANAILDHLPAVNFDATLKGQYDGEARFLRAMYYFNLVRLFGPVQLITTEINDPYGTSNTGRTPVNDVYTLIENDLKAAENTLPTTITAANQGRASKWAAKALLGKVYLTEKKYSLASDKLKEIIDANVNSLMPAYTDAFLSAFSVNREVLLAVQYKGGQIGQGGNFYTQWTPFAASSPDFGFTNGPGDGINRPTADLIAAYPTGDVRKGASIALTYTSTTGTQVSEPYPVKFIQKGIIKGESDVDFPVLRYADVLLMYAEAVNEQGAITPAGLEAVNKVIRRSRNLPVNTANATVDLTGSISQTALRTRLELERRLEFAFESQRWFDLVRTDRFVPVMTAQGKPAQPFQTVYPIPQRETDLNKNLSQNTGY